MDLTDRASHFEFGKNWLSYSQRINDERIEQAELSLKDLLRMDLHGKSFLDIGSGSGLFSLAALRLGARPLRAVDIDENSVAATRQLLEARSPSKEWNAERASILEPNAIGGEFDVVYSWGVLHHTGKMWRAIENAAKRVAPRGHLALALYRKTWLCPFWTVEKRMYTQHPRTFAPLANALYKGFWISTRYLFRENPFEIIRSYHSSRGMSWSHDVHDWLGGYPYESATADEVSAFVRRLGFELVHTDGSNEKKLGILGSGCAEYLFRRV